MKLPLCALLVGYSLFALSCKGGDQNLVLQLGREQFTLEVANTQRLREIGLMHRDSMPANHGMLFVFETNQELSFYMKNTRIPLSIAFITEDGLVANVEDMQPFSLQTIRSNGPCRYAIELNQGRFAQVGIRAGSRITLPRF